MPGKAPMLQYEWREPLHGETAPFNLEVDEYDNEDPDWHWDNDEIDRMLETSPDMYLYEPAAGGNVCAKKDILYVKYAILCGGEAVAQVLWPAVRVAGYETGGGAWFEHYYNVNLDRLMKDLRQLLCRYERKRDGDWKPPAYEIRCGEWDAADAWKACDSFVENLAPLIKYDNGEWSFKRIPEAAG